jgi:hypothetical protein
MGARELKAYQRLSLTNILMLGAKFPANRKDKPG